MKSYGGVRCIFKKIHEVDYLGKQDLIKIKLWQKSTELRSKL